MESTQSGIQLFSISEFLKQTDADMKWVVDRLLPAGGLSILVSKPKVGKSTLIRHLAICVARGESFAGRTSWPGSVALLCLEDSAPMVRESLKEQGVRDDDQIYIHTGSVDTSRSIRDLSKLIKDHDARLVVIDTLLRFLRISDANDYAKVTTALDPLLDVVRSAHDCHVMLSHHTTKGERDGGDAILGSTALFGTVDVALMLKKYADRRELSALEFRCGDGLEPTTMFKDEGGGVSLGTSGSPGDKATSVEEEIVAELKAGPRTRDQIKSAIGRQAQRVTDSLEQLVCQQRITKQGKGQRGDPFTYALSTSIHGENSVPCSLPIEEHSRERNNSSVENDPNALAKEEGAIGRDPTVRQHPDLPPDVGEATGQKPNVPEAGGGDQW